MKAIKIKFEVVYKYYCVVITFSCKRVIWDVGEGFVGDAIGFFVLKVLMPYLCNFAAFVAMFFDDNVDLFMSS